MHQLAVMRHDSAPVDYVHSHAAHTAHVGDAHQVQSKNEHNDLHLKLGEGIKLTSKDLSGAEGSRISVVKAHNPLDDYKGRTVRELSRLWRYLDGADPDARK